MDKVHSVNTDLCRLPGPLHPSSGAAPPPVACPFPLRHISLRTLVIVIYVGVLVPAP